VSALQTVLFSKIVNFVTGKIAEFLMLMLVKDNYGMWVLRLHRWESKKEKDHWEDQDVGGWTILKWILERWDGMEWIGLRWLSGGLL
jgi:hypothetical protein